MVLFPFKKRETQKLVSVIAIIIGIILMIATTTIKIVINISSFVLGAIITLIGFVYFLDVQ